MRSNAERLEGSEDGSRPYDAEKAITVVISLVLSSDRTFKRYIHTSYTVNTESWSKGEVGLTPRTLGAIPCRAKSRSLST